MVTKAWLWRVAGVAGVCLIIVLSLVPGPYRPHTGAPGGFEHFAAYALTALVLALGWRSFTHIVLIIAGLFVLAGGLEMAQHFVPGRSVALATPIFSGLGGLCGVALAAAAGRWPTPAASRESG